MEVWWKKTFVNIPQPPLVPHASVSTFIFFTKRLIFIASNISYKKNYSQKDCSSMKAAFMQRVLCSLKVTFLKVCGKDVSQKLRYLKKQFLFLCGMKSELFYVISSRESIPKSSTEATKEKSNDKQQDRAVPFCFCKLRIFSSRSCIFVRGR